jgi:hypothetical protein
LADTKNSKSNGVIQKGDYDCVFQCASKLQNDLSAKDIKDIYFEIMGWNEETLAKEGGSYPSLDLDIAGIKYRSFGKINYSINDFKSQIKLGNIVSFGMEVENGYHNRLLKGVTIYRYSGKSKMHFYDPSVGKYTMNFRNVIKTTKFGYVTYHNIKSKLGKR